MHIYATTSNAYSLHGAYITVIDMEYCITPLQQPPTNTSPSGLVMDVGSRIPTFVSGVNVAPTDSAVRQSWRR